MIHRFPKKELLWRGVHHQYQHHQREVLRKRFCSSSTATFLDVKTSKLKSIYNDKNSSKNSSLAFEKKFAEQQEEKVKTPPLFAFQPIAKPDFEKIDSEEPHLWFQGARQMKRKIICHIGQTNSGKTHNALERLKGAVNGVYAAPLRLLAWQVAQDLNCNLLTGQETNHVEGSNVLSCTVEMCNLNELYDIAVIDEYQIIASEDRGWAFSRVILGIQASEIHVCGEEGAFELLKKICSLTGDEIEVFEYERLSPLNTMKKPIENVSKVEPGDCVVVFSRKGCYYMKKQIEMKTPYKCAIVYGNLPPETRKHQATLFNKADNAYSVLVSTDAIGMGLNLSIKRVLFSQLEKYDGKTQRPLTIREIKQIAGRAGRYGHTDSATGFVGSIGRDLKNHQRIASALAITRPIQVKKAYVYPPKEFLRARFVNIFISRLEKILDMEQGKLGKEKRKKLRKKKMDHLVGYTLNRSYKHVTTLIEDMRRKMIQLESSKKQRSDSSPVQKDHDRDYDDEDERDLSEFLDQQDQEIEYPFLISEMPEVTEKIDYLNGIPLCLSTLQLLTDSPARLDCELNASFFKRYAMGHAQSTLELITDAFDDPFYVDMFAPLIERSEIEREAEERKRYGNFESDDESDDLSSFEIELDEFFGGDEQGNNNSHDPDLPRIPKIPKVSSIRGNDMVNLEKLYYVLDYALWVGVRFNHPEEELEHLHAERILVMKRIASALEKKVNDRMISSKRRNNDDRRNGPRRRNRATNQSFRDRWTPSKSKSSPSFNSSSSSSSSRSSDRKKINGSRSGSRSRPRR